MMFSLYDLDPGSTLFHAVVERSRGLDAELLGPADHDTHHPHNPDNSDHTHHAHDSDHAHHSADDDQHTAVGPRVGTVDRVCGRRQGDLQRRHVHVPPGAHVAAGLGTAERPGVVARELSLSSRRGG